MYVAYVVLRCSVILMLNFFILTVQSEELEVLTKLYMNKGSKKRKTIFKGYGPVFSGIGRIRIYHNSQTSNFDQGVLLS